jgi:hypothetical protein
MVYKAQMLMAKAEVNQLAGKPEQATACLPSVQIRDRFGVAALMAAASGR